MLKIILTIILLLALAAPGWGAEWWVKSVYPGTGTGAGTSYTNAFKGFAAVVWGPGGVQGGDTLWVVDTFLEYTDNYGPSTASHMTVGASGTSDAENQRIIIRGDYVQRAGDPSPGTAAPGIVYGLSRYTTNTWVDTGTNGVFRYATNTNPTWMYEVIGGVATKYVNWEYCVIVTDQVPSTAVHTDTEIIDVTSDWATDTPILFNSIYTLPAPLAKNTVYYAIRVDATHIQVAAAPGGGAIDLTSAGSGTGNHIKISKDPTTAELNRFSAGSMWCNSTGYYMYIKTPSGIAPSTAGSAQAFHSPGNSVSGTITISGQDYITIKNITIYGAITLINATYITIEDSVKVYDAGMYAIPATGDCDHLKVTGSFIDNAGNGLYTIRIALGEKVSDYITVTDNTVTNIIPYDYGMGTEDCHAIGLQGGLGNTVQGNKIDNASTAVTLYTGDGYYTASLDIIGNFATDIWRWYIGKADSRSSGTTLVDPSRNFVTWGTAITVGRIILNRTTGASGTVTGVGTTFATNDTLTCTLSGGTRQTWLKGDIYLVSPPEYNSPFSGHGSGFEVHGTPTSGGANVRIANNIGRNVMGAGIRAVGTATYDTEIYNNTLDACNVGIATINATGAIYYLDARNNIITNPTDWGTGLPVVYHWAYGGAAFEATAIVDYNLYYPAPGADLRFFWTDSAEGYAKAPIAWAAWASAAGIQKGRAANETHPVTSDPLFLNASGLWNLATDFKLKPKSLAGRKGVRIPGITTDFGGYRINNKPIGAWSLPATPGSPSPF